MPFEGSVRANLERGAAAPLGGFADNVFNIADARMTASRRRGAALITSDERASCAHALQLDVTAAIVLGRWLS